MVWETQAGSLSRYFIYSRPVIGCLETFEAGHHTGRRDVKIIPLEVTRPSTWGTDMFRLASLLKELPRIKFSTTS